jgi:hypothetical protein
MATNILGGTVNILTLSGQPQKYFCVDLDQTAAVADAFERTTENDNSCQIDMMRP